MRPSNFKSTNAALKKDQPRLRLAYRRRLKKGRRKPPWHLIRPQQRLPLPVSSANPQELPPLSADDDERAAPGFL
jgi:hypothetical protein